MQIFKPLSLVLIALSLGACATSQPLTEAGRSQITTISIGPQLNSAEGPSFIGPGGAFFGVFGALAEMSQGEAIAKQMNDEGVDIEQIVQEELQHQAKEHPFLASRLNERGDNSLEIEIRMYGIAQKHGLSSEYRPIIGLTARLYSADRAVLWEKYDFVTGMSSATTPHTFEDYFEKPGTMGASFSEAARAVITLLLDELK